MRKLLLVTGSRVLADRDDAKEWAYKFIIDKFNRLQMVKGDVLLAGGADGPDTWSATEARTRSYKVVEFKLDGGRYENNVKVGNWCDLEWKRSIPYERFPLERNLKLIECALKAKDAGWLVNVLALHAPWSPTHGTAHTVLHSGFARLEVEEHSFKLPEPERREIVWIDLETGGRVAKIHPIIEIGAVRTDATAKRVLSTFEMKLAVEPGMSVDPGAAIVNGYTPELWHGAIEARDALQRFIGWLPQKQFTAAGYNFAFDKSFLQQAFSRHGLNVPNWHPTHLDPLYTVRSTLKSKGKINSAKLDEVCAYFGLYNDTRHRALADAERARLVYLALLGHKPEATIFEMTGDGG